MLTPSKEFERQIERIHALIEGPDSVITWNDKILDPDNAEQTRQIDVTIRRDSKLTLIECRLHSAKQDVQWIEELIGRRISLKADGVIAVSASGFTEGAKKKASEYGIILRDLIKLTDEEIKSWGKCAKVKISFFHLEKFSFLFFFPPEAQSHVEVRDVKDALKSQSLFRGIIEKICFGIDEKKPPYPLSFRVVISIPTVAVKGFETCTVQVTGRLSVTERQLNTPIVLAYDSPQINALDRNVFLEKKDLGKTEVVQSGNTVSILMDLTALGKEDNRLLRHLDFDFQRIVNVKGKNTSFLMDKSFLDLRLAGMRLGVAFRVVNNPPPLSGANWSVKD